MTDDARQKAEDHYYAALDLVAEGEQERALAEYQRSLAADPTFTEAMHGMARALQDLNRLDEAIAVAKRHRGTRSGRRAGPHQPVGAVSEERHDSGSGGGGKQGEDSGVEAAVEERLAFSLSYQLSVSSLDISDTEDWFG